MTRTAGPGSFRLVSTSVVWQCVMRCWASGVFLAPLAQRFLTLSLEVFARYRAYLGSALAQVRIQSG
ncbi:conserved oligomeric Golgi complex subunit 2 (COG2) [Paratrimastix pyriformis]|uniref:Conserved oligomeric Golgi complex subunit 2 (COG2) n=1 Tax=Paratrimastix pyriformis TaxID=342808 RepID=A0ABQ9YMN7_9EUKA|nr:conserved oligomeric Golgi complex subunit 2 (COG2) [Paratrimastix pyriformis]